MRQKQKYSAAKKIKTLLVGFVALIVVASLVVGFCLYSPWGLYSPIESPYNQYYRNQPIAEKSEVVEIAGAPNPDIVNLLILGIDKGTETEMHRTTMHQADTILFCSFHKKTGDIDILSIPRNIEINVPHFDLLGELAYYAPVPICSAHSLGKDAEDAAFMMLSAVQNLLGGVPIHGVLSLELQAVSSVVDALGGITVNCFFDIAGFYGVAPDTPIHLDGETALDYVRARSLPGMDGSNETRMLRQMGFLYSLFEQVSVRVKSNPAIALTLEKATRKYRFTNLSFRELLFCGFTAMNKGELSLHRTIGVEKDEFTFIPDCDMLAEYIETVCFI